MENIPLELSGFNLKNCISFIPGYDTRYIMGYTVLIVESPSKCSKIEEFLGDGYRCIATCGHIRSLDGLGSINISAGFQPTYKMAKGKSQCINNIKSVISRANKVVLASDEDREGEAIAWHICMVCKLDPKTTKRITFNEITKKAIERGLASPRAIDLKLVEAQQSRQILDLLVGFRVSPSLWDNITSQKGGSSLSAGRCQSPALRIIYDNQKEIDSNPGSISYKITAYFLGLNIPLVLDCQIKEGVEVQNFLKCSINHSHMLSIGAERTITSDPPQPFTTSSLQQKASSELRISPKVTDEICQKLYNAGLITYIRTDRAQYADEFLETAQVYISDNYPDMNIYTSHHRVTSSENAQEAHEAIRPTKLANTGDDLCGQEKKIYTLIRSNTIASCLPPSKSLSKSLKMSSPLDGKFYKASTKKAIFLGWKIVFWKQEEKTEYDALAYLSVTKPFNVQTITANVGLHNQKMHYTEAKLIKELEERGIGRPSTFSSLVAKIIERGYVVKANLNGRKINVKEFILEDSKIEELSITKTLGSESQKLQITNLGQEVIEFLLRYYDHLFSYDFTKNLESKLDCIARGRLTRQEVCNECNEALENCLAKVPRSRIELDSMHVYLIGKYGPVIKKTEDGKVTFIKVRKDVNPNDVASGKLPISELLDTNLQSLSSSACQSDLGLYQNKAVLIRTGKYGKYIQWGESTISIPEDIEEPYDINKLRHLLINPIIRQINKNISLRRGKFGTYFYYKTNKMSKPKFIRTTKTVNGSSSAKDIQEWVKKNT